MSGILLRPIDPGAGAVLLQSAVEARRGRPDRGGAERDYARGPALLVQRAGVHAPTPSGGSNTDTPWGSTAAGRFLTHSRGLQL